MNFHDSCHLFSTLVHFSALPHDALRTGVHYTKQKQSFPILYVRLLYNKNGSKSLPDGEQLPRPK